MTKTIIHLQNIHEARAFAFYQLNERRRHLQDVARIEQEVKIICEEWGITEIPDPPADIWIEVRKPGSIAPGRVPEEPFYFGDAIITGRE